jgi:hypothetical protein
LKKEKGNCEIQGARQLQLTDIHAISFNIGLNYPSVMKFGGWTSIFPIIKKSHPSVCRIQTYFSSIQRDSILTSFNADYLHQWMIYSAYFKELLEIFLY